MLLRLNQCSEFCGRVQCGNIIVTKSYITSYTRCVNLNVVIVIMSSTTSLTFSGKARLWRNIPLTTISYVICITRNVISAQNKVSGHGMTVSGYLTKGKRGIINVS